MPIVARSKHEYRITRNDGGFELVEAESMIEALKWWMRRNYGADPALIEKVS